MGILLKPGDPEYKNYQIARQSQLESIAKASDKATDSQWQMIDFAIRAFIGAYPKQWAAFQADLNQGRNTYNDAKEGGLKKSQWRNTAAFPIAYVRDPLTGEEQEKNLLEILKKIIPHLTHKHSANFEEFLKRYPMFMPSKKTNWSSGPAFQGYSMTDTSKDRVVSKTKDSVIEKPKKKRGRKKKDG